MLFKLTEFSCDNSSQRNLPYSTNITKIKIVYSRVKETTEGLGGDFLLNSNRDSLT